MTRRPGRQAVTEFVPPGPGPDCAGACPLGEIGRSWPLIRHLHENVARKYSASALPAVKRFKVVEDAHIGGSLNRSSTCAPAAARCRGDTRESGVGPR